MIELIPAITLMIEQHEQVLPCASTATQSPLSQILAMGENAQENCREPVGNNRILAEQRKHPVKQHRVFNEVQTLMRIISSSLLRYAVQVDVNNDGVIDRAEFEHALMKGTLVASNRCVDVCMYYSWYLLCDPFCRMLV